MPSLERLSRAKSIRNTLMPHFRSRTGPKFGESTFRSAKKGLRGVLAAIDLAREGAPEPLIRLFSARPAVLYQRGKAL